MRNAEPPITPADLERAIRRHARYSLGHDLPPHPAGAPTEHFQAAALAVRDQLVDRMLATEARYDRHDAKRLYYLSMEFLMGRALGNNLCNLGLGARCAEALAALGADLEEVRDCEPDAALGNGGLGRLAACFLDSLATLGLAGYGYGINYEYGLFRQSIVHGEQRERPDNWLATPTPWEIARPDEACVVPLYGHVEHGTDRDGHYNPMWLGWQVIVGVPHDMPIAGYGGETVNVLRLYSARASDEFDMAIFNDGDYLRAVEAKMRSETISKVLYPSDAVEVGRELRLIQEYFFVACAVRDIIRRYQRRHATFDAFAGKVAIQLNDTHPTLAVAELMRALIDEHGVPWEQAWEMTVATLGYTNHTLMPEALERWPVPLLERVLPRHLQIIYEINRRFLDVVSSRWPDDDARRARLSIIDDAGPREVRMAHLAIVGSHAVNGVSALHSELVKRSLVPDFAELWPERFSNKTNGITPRRWLLKANPGLARLITDAIGDAWIRDLDALRGLEPLAADAAFQEAFRAVKRANKTRLAAVAQRTARVAVDPATLFDVQAKRIHEYKRQLLMLMGVIHAYLRLVEDGVEPLVPRTYLFAGKAAPGYWAAKQIIRLINAVARVVNADPRARGHLALAFLPDYRVSLAERIIPAAEVSEQISTAGMEASGTGNMKFALNGALTIGTLDGANIEIGEEVGWENIFIFGFRAEQIQHLRDSHDYRPREYYDGDERVRRVLDAINGERFCAGQLGAFSWLYDALLDHDHYFHLADMGSYLDAQARVAEAYRDPAAWTRTAILNVARMGKFSSDRTIREYARDIWHLEPAPIGRRRSAERGG